MSIDGLYRVPRLALVSGRFRLDPKAPAPQRAVPPPPPPPTAAAPPVVARPPPDPLPAPAPTKRRRGLMLGAVVVALLLLGGVVAVYVATAKSYPGSYLLETREYPSGLSKARLSADELDELGMRSNPGEIDRDQLDTFETPDGTDPEEGHALVLQDASGARVIVTAVRYADEEDAVDAAKQARALCSFANGAVLRDGKVLVGILPERGGSRTEARAVASALREKTDDLVTVC